MWLKLIRKPDDTSMLNRRQFEVCVFSYLAAEVRSGDICIAGSESFADHRQQLLPWHECEPLLKEYCDRMELPDSAAEFTSNLRSLLTEKAAAVDQKYPQNGELTINNAGEPVLSRVSAREIPESAISLQANITQKMATGTCSTSSLISSTGPILPATSVPSRERTRRSSGPRNAIYKPSLRLGVTSGHLRPHGT